jgi:LacI family transcriptional regulator
MAKTRRIAIVINLDWTMKHHQEVFGGIQEYAKERGWECVLWPFAPEVVDKRGRKLYDGIIGRVRPELEESARKAKIPLVNVWVSSPCKNLPAVLPDEVEAGRMAAEHLRRRGFRRFGYVGYTRTTSSQDLQRGFREVAREHKIKITSFLASPTFSESIRSWSRFQKDIHTWMEKLQAPVGVVTLNDKIARYVINAAYDMGYEVPGDMAVVGLGNEELVCLNPEPSITSIDLGWHQIGEHAGELLESLMNRRRPPKEPVLIPPLSLVPRKSTDAFNVDDDLVALALRFIAEQSHTPIKVKDVVAHVPISWSSLERRFKDCRSSTIGKEITRFRIERAKRMLAETELLVKQVAEASGFANTQRLCEVFRRVEGMTPEQYRLARD